MTSEIKKFKENEKDLRILPMNIEAEQALLAALLNSNLSTDFSSYPSLSQVNRRKK